MKKLVCCGVTLVFVLLVISCSSPVQKSDSVIHVGGCFSCAGDQLTKSVEQVKDSNRFPFYTAKDGTWETKESNWWSSGFFAGCLWFMYEYTSDEIWKERAMKWTVGMEREQFNKDDSDTGYRMMSSFGNGYRLTGDEHYKEVLIESARSLASLYNEKVGCLKGFTAEKWKYPVIVDHMMNLEILFWAAKNGGDPGWTKIAESHALNTMRDHVREDGSTIQIVDYNPETGEVRGHDTLLGYSPDSAWSRGQAEAFFGFAIAYRETKNPVFLETAQKLADYFIDNLPDDYIPYWDFKSPNIPDDIKDSSAASMAADGLL